MTDLSCVAGNDEVLLRDETPSLVIPSDRPLWDWRSLRLGSRGRKSSNLVFGSLLNDPLALKRPCGAGAPARVAMRQGRAAPNGARWIFWGAYPGLTPR